MGGSTNTVLHLLAAAQEGEVPFTMADIDRLSRRVPNSVQGGSVRTLPCISKMCIVPEESSAYSLSWIVAGLLHRSDSHTVHAPTLGARPSTSLTSKRADSSPAVEEFYRAAPGGVRTTEAFQSERALCGIWTWTARMV
jgi:dihydroxy-acid dehydratase